MIYLTGKHYFLRLHLKSMQRQLQNKPGLQDVMKFNLKSIKSRLQNEVKINWLIQIKTVIGFIWVFQLIE